MLKSERQVLDDYTARAAKFGITVVDTYKDPGLNRMVVWTDPKVRDGDSNHSNLTRFGDIVSSREHQQALADWLAKGNEIKTFPSEVAQGSGLKATATRGRRVKGGRPAEPITTGDAKFDMYLNALPGPVRELVVPLSWDPRALYKEYRILKKEGLIAKYATDENRKAAGIVKEEA